MPKRYTHTTGPWAVCENPPNDQWYEGTTIFSISTQTRVADICSLAYNGEANANLIAAAPDMYEVLTSVKNRIEVGGLNDTSLELILNLINKSLSNAVGVMLP